MLRYRILVLCINLDFAFTMQFSKNVPTSVSDP